MLQATHRLRAIISYKMDSVPSEGIAGGRLLMDSIGYYFQYTQQSNRDQGGGELAVAPTMRITRMVLTVAAVTTTVTADDAVGGMASTG